MIWRVLLVDTHRTQGDLTFRVGPRTSTPPLRHAAWRRCWRSAQLAFMVLVAEPDAGLRKQLSRLIWRSLVLAAVSGAAWFVLFAVDLTGDTFADAVGNGGAWTVLTETRFGIVAGSCSRWRWRWRC